MDGTRTAGVEASPQRQPQSQKDDPRSSVRTSVRRRHGKIRSLLRPRSSVRSHQADPTASRTYPDRVDARRSAGRRAEEPHPDQTLHQSLGTSTGTAGASSGVTTTATWSSSASRSIRCPTARPATPLLAASRSVPRRGLGDPAQLPAGQRLHRPAARRRQRPAPLRVPPGRQPAPAARQLGEQLRGRDRDVPRRRGRPPSGAASTPTAAGAQSAVRRPVCRPAAAGPGRPGPTGPAGPGRPLRRRPRRPVPTAVGSGRGHAARLRLATVRGVPEQEGPFPSVSRRGTCRTRSNGTSTDRARLASMLTVVHLVARR